MRSSMADASIVARSNEDEDLVVDEEDEEEDADEEVESLTTWLTISTFGPAVACVRLSKNVAEKRTMIDLFVWKDEFKWIDVSNKR